MPIRPQISLALGVTAAVALGVAAPFYAVLTGGGAAALVAPPAMLLLAAVFLLRPSLLFLLILLTRSASDGVFEAARTALGDGLMGPGAVINACVILLCFSLVAREPGSFPRWTHALWAGFFLTGLYGVLISTQKGEAIRLLLAWVSNWAVFVCAVWRVRSRRDFDHCLGIVLASSLLPTAYALVQLAGHAGDLGAFRLQSTFAHANIYAFYLVLMISVCFCLFEAAAGRGVYRLCLSLYLVSQLALLMLTQTRSAWLACLLTIAAYGWFYRRRYLLCLAALFLVALLLPGVRDRLSDLGGNSGIGHEEKLNSLAWRIELWIAALTWMEPLRYLFGYGVGGFRDLSPDFFPRSLGEKWDAHNVYVQWLFDVGVVGLVAYLWLQLSLLRVVRTLRQTDRLVWVTLLAAVTGYLLVSFSDNMMFYLSFNWYYWFLIGAGCALARQGAAAES